MRMRNLIHKFFEAAYLSKQIFKCSQSSKLHCMLKLKKEGVISESIAAGLFEAIGLSFKL